MKSQMVATLAACILVTAKSYIGDNINCVTGFQGQQHQAIETYCFISSTFSLINGSVGPYPGLGTPEGSDDSLVRHAYYQWVPLVLAVQMGVLYFPKWLWKNIDKDKFKTVLNNLDSVYVIPAEATQKIRESAEYMCNSMRTHTSYALQFLICEIIAFTISIGNLYFTNTFLGLKFFSFGKESFSYLLGDITDISNPLNEVFPKIAKCTWRKFGPSGSIQEFDSMCVLPLNIVNEKTYILLWLVFVVFTAVAGISLLFHLVTFVSSTLRNKYLHHKLKNENCRQTFYKLKNKINYGDWFIIKQLSHSMWVHNFERWLEELSDITSN